MYVSSSSQHNIMYSSAQNIYSSPRYISRLPTIYTYVTHNIYLRYPQYVPLIRTHNIFVDYPQYIRRLPTIYTFDIHNIYIRYPQHIRELPTTCCLQDIRNVLWVTLVCNTLIYCG